MRIFEGLQHAPVGKTGRGFEMLVDVPGHPNTSEGFYNWEAHFMSEAGTPDIIQRMTTLAAAPPDRRAWNGITYRLGGYDVKTFRAFYWRL